MAPSYKQNTAKIGEIHGTVNLGLKRPVHEGYAYGGGTRRYWGTVQWGSSGEVPDDGVLASWGYMRRYWGPYGEGTRRYWRAVQWGRYGVAWRYWGVPLTPLTTQGERGGIPWPR